MQRLLFCHINIYIPFFAECHIVSLFDKSLISLSNFRIQFANERLVLLTISNA